MDETAFRILDALSRNPGKGISISELSREIGRLHGTAYYSNIYKTLHRLGKDGIVQFAHAGNSSLASLNLGDRRAFDALAEMELRKRRSLLATSEAFRRLFDALSAAPSACPTSVIDAERNLKLNRVELLIQMPEGMEDAGIERLRGHLAELERRLDIRLDALTLDEGEFRSLLAAPDRNALKEMLPRQTALLAPDLFWTRIRNAWAHGIRIQFDQEETNPAKTSERDIIHNLARFGYTEFGSSAKDGRELGLEYVVTAILLRGDARRIRAIPVILAKNRPSYPLLLFLSKKHGVRGQLYGLLKALARYEGSKDLRRALRAFEAAKVTEIRADEAGVKRTMETYNAIPR